MWSVGEVAVCVKDPVEGVPAFMRIFYGDPPEPGKLYRVLEVTLCPGCQHEALVVKKDGPPWHSEYFRRVQKGEGEITDLIKKCRPRDRVREREKEDA